MHRHERLRIFLSNGMDSEYCIAHTEHNVSAPRIGQQHSFSETTLVMRSVMKLEVVTVTVSLLTVVDSAVLSSCDNHVSCCQHDGYDHLCHLREC